MLNFSPFRYNTETKKVQNLYLEKEVIQYHKEYFSFSKRKMNTKAIEFFSYFFKISESISFVILNFLYLIISGFFLGKIVDFIFNNYLFTFYSILAFYLNFSVLFSFFAPIYTYDDLLQYMFLFIATYTLLKNNVFLFFIFFSLAGLTRESSFFTIPILLMLLFFQNERKNLKKTFVIYSIAILVSILIFAFYIFTITNIKIHIKDAENRWIYLFINFSSYHRTVESLMSWISIFLLPIILSIKYYKNLSSKEKNIFISFYLVLFFNTTLMYITCLARESRLFNIPIILFLPFYGKLLFIEIKNLKIKIKKAFNSYKFYLYLTFTTIFSVYLSKFAYKTSIGITSEMYFNLYFFIYWLIFFLMIYFIPKNKY